MKAKHIKLLVTLTTAKIEVLKLKADRYNWDCHIDDDTKAQLNNAITEIDALLKGLNYET